MCEALNSFLTAQVTPDRKIGDVKADFARRISVTVRQLDRYLSGEQMPRPSGMAAIREATGGAVRPDHFFTPSVSAAGAATTPVTLENSDLSDR